MTQRFREAPIVEKMVETRLGTIRKDLEVNEFEERHDFFFYKIL